MIQMQLDGEVFHNSDMYSKLFYDSISNVRSLLRISSLGVYGRDKWMTILDTSYSIAYRYDIILVTLSTNMNMSFFTLKLSLDYVFM